MQRQKLRSEITLCQRAAISLILRSVRETNRLETAGRRHQSCQYPHCYESRLALIEALLVNHFCFQESPNPNRDSALPTDLFSPPPPPTTSPHTLHPPTHRL